MTRLEDKVPYLKASSGGREGGLKSARDYAHLDPRAYALTRGRQRYGIPYTAARYTAFAVTVAVLKIHAVRYYGRNFWNLRKTVSVAARAGFHFKIFRRPLVITQVIFLVELSSLETF